MKDRYLFAVALAKRTGAYALDYFQRLEDLQIESKGHQNLVSQADRETEDLIRDAILESFPQDGLFGEEHGRREGSSGYTWIIDPIDGTANFVAGIPLWCVLIACVKDDEVVFGVTFDPNHDECFSAHKGKGAHLNGKPINASQTQSVSQGAVGIGYSTKRSYLCTLEFIRILMSEGGVFNHNGSGGLSLAYVAAGRLIGYTQGRMNLWDCAAGLLLVEEAGGLTAPINMSEAMEDGARITAAASGVYEDLERICKSVYSR